MASDFAGRLRGLRIQNNLSQREAASALGLSQALLSHYENGVREPRLDFIAKLCAYYRVTSDYLLGITQEPSGAATPERLDEVLSLLEQARTQLRELRKAADG